jgi:hypothetical protein
VETEKGEGEEIRVADRWGRPVSERKRKGKGASSLGCAVPRPAGLDGLAAYLEREPTRVSC